MPELLLELFSEEIPARMQGKAAKDLERMVNDRLLAAGFMPEGVKAFAGPRRLALIATGLPVRQPDRKEEKKGPRVGAPEKAIDGFLKSAGLSSLDQCEIVDDKKGQYYVARILEKGRETSAVLAETVPAIIREFPWPKSMRWGASKENGGDLRWVRPLKSILCCFADEIVPFEIDGVRSGDATMGHRRHPGGPIHARNFDRYVPALTNAKVMLDGEARAAMIAADARTLCEAQGLELVEDKGLLAEVSGLAEWPVVMMGSFDGKFLALPDEVLTASMRGHQKYFSVKDPKTGRLANKFVYVANIDAPDAGKAMRAGYERVLTARLSDAWYLYHQDLKTPLEERVRDLDRVTFFEGLGSIGDKARRIAALAKEIAPAVGADRQLAEKAALLAKADLTTGMVYEFPELQGLMGRYYYLAQSSSPLSRRAGEGDRAIAGAIRDHYKPAGANDDVPSAPVSVAVAIADKMDTLVAFFSIGKRPTGSSDPFALRRAALGVIEIAVRNSARIRLRDIIRTAFGGMNGLHPFSEANWEGEQPWGPRSILVSFFHERLKVYLKEKGRRYDQIDAVLATAGGALEDDLVLIIRKLDALEAFLKTDDGANLAAGYKRAANIVKAEEKKDVGRMKSAGAGEAADFIRPALNEKLLTQAEEKALFAALKSAEEKAAKAVAAEKFEGAMAALASLRVPIDAFFDKVTVNADKWELRANRLALLKRFIAATANVADLGKLEG
ncbi:MAG: glycine--tRNA ligase subunit beta [Pseudomonadota bacterium]